MASEVIWHEIRMRHLMAVQWWLQAGDLALEFAIEVLVGLPLRFTDRQWLKQQLLTYFAGLYVLPWPIPGKQQVISNCSKSRLKLAAHDGDSRGYLWTYMSAGYECSAAANFKRPSGTVPMKPMK
jgi:hypothetical protein